MKKLWDKPYKVNLFAITILILGAISIKGDTYPLSTSKVVELDTVITSQVVVAEPSIEEVAFKLQKKREVTLSRGGSPFRQTTKQPTEREIINSYIREIALKYNIEPELIMSIIQTESEYNPKAKNGNCLGLMQVSSYWHKDRANKLGVKDFYDPYGNILIGVDYISELLKQYKDPRLVLMLYNMDHNTAISMYKNGQITNYAKTIIARAEIYKKGE